MNWFEALILGLIQGLTEFLPVSSSGHLEIGKVLLNVQVEENLTFAVLVHFATVLSTITVFFTDLRELTLGVFRFRWNDSTKYVAKILLSLIPVMIIGLVFEEQINGLFTGNLVLVGSSLLFTALLLSTTQVLKKDYTKKIPFADALIMGIAQAVAIVPGISRSGATITTGLLLKNDRKEVARFSFLMVLIPVIGAAFLDLMKWKDAPSHDIAPLTLLVGFLAAYASGVLACKWMIRIVSRGRLIWFAVYCAIIGLMAIIFS
ncbi:MAG: undecaprenyl-diphosphate phosphatase [Bacteroidota bacterium]